ncbi:MAG: hypothetical protein KJ070_08585 [Verrucomicrobia bacterium]|nr:hypothetical protein [Verrucomicrobiota bacterium]
MLMDYPSLLTFATTNDLNAAKLAFQNGADRYMEASQVIRNRSTNVTRLFNYDAGVAANEEKFRLTLTDLINSLAGAVTLAVETNYTVFMGAHFSGASSPRSFLPWFRGNGFGLGTLPDSTFGGLVYGLTDEQADEFLAKYLFPIPTISAIFSNFGGQFQFPINVAKGRGYVIQVSTNLLDWFDYSAFFAFDGRYQFTDQYATGFPRRFYRLVDRTGNMPPPANDSFANRALIANMNVPVTSYTENASYEPPETNWLSGIGHTVWWSWTSPVSTEVAVLASGGGNCWPISVFTGGSLNGLTQIANDYNEVRFTAQAGVTYQIAVDTCWQDGGVNLVITRPPTVTVNSPVDGAVFTSPANISISGSASDPDGQIQQISVSAWPGLNSKTANSSFAFQWTNVPGGNYYLNFSATDDAGCQAWDSRSIRVHPVNDDLTNATAISGAPLAVSGSNAGANKETREPNHAGNSGGNSIWWSWTAASNGPVTILCDISNQWGSVWPLLGVYTGNVVSNLSLVRSNAPSYGNTAVVSFTASLGQTYKIAVDANYTGTATLQFVPTAAPTVAITNPPNNAIFIGPTNIQISAQASDSDGTIARVEFYADGSLIETRFAPPYSVTWSNVPADGYSRQLVAYAVDNGGVGVFSAPVYVTVRPPPPPNDNFVNRTLLTGTNAISAGTTVGATVETGEPYHAGWYRNHSVWWSWQAPKSGAVTVTATGTDYSYLVMGVYTGSAVSSLSYVASGVYGGRPYNSCNVSFSATSGTTYAIAVDGGGNAGPVSLSVVQP